MSGASTARFDDVAEFYDQQPNPMLKLEERFLTGLLLGLRQKDIVEVGCGTGRWLRRFVDSKPRSVTGVDPSGPMLEVARGCLPPEVMLLRGSAEDLPLPNESADVVLLSFALSYCPDAGRAIQEVARIARPGAQVFITDVHPETAERLNWQRSFRGPSGTVVMNEKRRRAEEIGEIFRCEGFQQSCLLELPFGEEERETFASAGKETYFDSITSFPAIYIAQFVLRADTRAELVIQGARVAFGPRAAANAEVTIRAGVITSLSTGRPSTPRNTGEDLDLTSHLVLPGLINAHDHLEFGLYPKLGRGPYETCRAWAEDIHVKDKETIALHSKIPKDICLYWGALRNLLSGVTTVCHHNPSSSVFLNPDFPVRVIDRIAWGHSLSFDSQVAAKFRDSAPEVPFVLHAAEGVDECASLEVAELEEQGILSDRTVLVHGLNCSAEDIARINTRDASLVLCSTSNHFLFGRSVDPGLIPVLKNVILGTDSPLTAAGDMLDEISFAKKWSSLPDSELYEMCTSRSAAVLRLQHGEGSIRSGGAADLVVVRDAGGGPASQLPTLTFEDIHLVLVGGRIHLVSEDLLYRIPEELKEGLQPLLVENTMRWVRAPLPKLFEETQRVLGNVLYLGGKRVTYAG